MNYFKILFITGKAIFPYPILIFVNYIITFLVFPNLSIKKKYDDLDFVWSSLLFLFIYNIGDTIGKFVCGYRWTFNKHSVFYMFATRGYFIVVIPLLATTTFDDDSLINNYVFPYLVQLLFSITNGVVTSNLCMIIQMRHLFSLLKNVLSGIKSMRVFSMGLCFKLESWLERTWQFHLQSYLSVMMHDKSFFLKNLFIPFRNPFFINFSKEFIFSIILFDKFIYAKKCSKFSQIIFIHFI